MVVDRSHRLACKTALANEAGKASIQLSQNCLSKAIAFVTPVSDDQFVPTALPQRGIESVSEEGRKWILPFL